MQQEQRPGRRSVLGAAAALGAGAVTLGGGAGMAAAAPSAASATAAGDRRPGHGHGGGGLRDLPVPTVVGHRGGSGYRPEHTLGSYRFALENGADVIEQDVVPTKDGHLVCRHENDITGTTDVSSRPEFASRKTTKTVDGESHTGWFTEDFTLAELKTLRAKERLPQVRQHNTLYDGHWTVPTFEEVLKWADEEGRKRGRRIWLHVETKHPTYFRKLGLGLEERLAKLLRRYGRAGRNSYTFLQSFEPSSLQRLGRLGLDCPKILLLDDLPTRPWDFVEAKDPRTVADLITPKGLKWVSGFAQGIGPWLNLIIPRDKNDRLTKPTTLVRDAHAAGLVLHPYTMRNENSFLPADFRRGTDPNAYGDAIGAFKTYYATGIDGIFSDNCDTAVLAREEFLKGRKG
ncbi:MULTISPECIES: glycerophosphodiester phosphodiesterase [Streptomyces]|uniref:glycerophosphodiester phosphodiesterase n=1 Tax=Streptomyces TaxID=1883 RepID=UPI00163D3521|nr:MULTISPECIES: glycerophosphodiester phosphodiesterase [Streptomyces]MBC2879446.1 glycerophosphodiester phosphodiesterase [Streptomyces sp. TYQ1024]UBI39845.1 glycerophosphodiester phosphodiesterase [Streptomyces mobaraensis]UKW32426.1 glycerophosphodiester phosphodiesterase [Streptomyces sp. TYQ1024]